MRRFSRNAFVCTALTLSGCAGSGDRSDSQIDLYEQQLGSVSELQVEIRQKYDELLDMCADMAINLLIGDVELAENDPSTPQDERYDSGRRKVEGHVIADVLSCVSLGWGTVELPDMPSREFVDELVMCKVLSPPCIPRADIASS